MEAQTATTNTTSRLIKIRPLRNGTVTISGLTPGDLRLVARAIGEGSFAGGDQGGPVSEALLRFESALRVPCMFPGQGVDVYGNGAAAEDLYEEPINVEHSNRTRGEAAS